jgi:hypothetical protein
MDKQKKGDNKKEIKTTCSIIIEKSKKKLI